MALEKPADKRGAVVSPCVGQMLGRYKLLERVGEDGCGVVYAAEKTEPVRRRVALKVIKLGMDTKQVVAQFLKAPEDWRTPRPGGLRSGLVLREASWSAVALYRFLPGMR